MITCEMRIGGEVCDQPAVAFRIVGRYGDGRQIAWAFCAKHAVAGHPRQSQPMYFDVEVAS